MTSSAEVSSPTVRGQELVFTDYVRACAARGEPVAGEALERFLGGLRAALVHELKRRRLWHTSPHFFGILGARRWSEGDALLELAQDCSVFVLARLPTLEAHARIKQNVEGLVFRILRNFLVDRQRENDILGARCYRFLGLVVEAALVRDHLRRGSGDSDGYRMLALTGASLASEASPGGVEPALESWAERWVPAHLPTVMRLGPKHQEMNASRLAPRILELREVGVLAFSFAALVTAWRSQARRHWASLLAESPGPTSPEDRPPGWAFEDLQSYSTLRRCVEESIERVEEPYCVRLRLLELWQALVTSAEHDGVMPSERALARRLDLSRRQMSRLYRKLRPLVESCRRNLV